MQDGQGSTLHGLVHDKRDCKLQQELYPYGPELCSGPGL